MYGLEYEKKTLSFLDPVSCLYRNLNQLIDEK